MRGRSCLSAAVPGDTLCAADADARIASGWEGVESRLV